MADIKILGAGIAGVSANYHAEKLGYTCEIFEAAGRFGGLVDNFKVGGFRFDKAVHLSFTNNEYVRSIFDNVDYLRHKPQAYNYGDGYWLKHPVQNNLYPLKIDEKILAIESFINRPPIMDDSDYGNWLVSQYGNYIAEKYPQRYTQKYWSVPANQLSMDWVGNRMYKPSLKEVLTGAMTDETPNTYYAKEMRYPRIGGYRTFIENIASVCNIQFNKRAIRIDAKRKLIEFIDGSQTYYEHLISTIPLPELIKIIDDVPSNIKNAANDLWATSIELVSIGFNRPDIAKYLWFYIYDEDIAAARAYSPNLKSPDNVPENCSSLQFEIYHSQYKPLKMLKDELIEHIVSSLSKMKIADKVDIKVIDCRNLPYGNVVFDKGMTAKRSIVRSYLGKIGIETAGRFGEWDYLWSDQSLLSGKKAIERI